MSRRPTDKAGQNQQVIKNLLRLETNKMCADCKKNKHPRWASWNLGVFVCIRCSGIHRGMGTHISRVKSVDLDAWTDEQLQSIMKWGNARANRYWEHKLAAGHVPSDAKIENFIRTKYESRRWVMDGQMPDPSTLGGDGDEDVPLSTVQDRARLDRSGSQRAASGPAQAAPSGVRRAPAAAPASFDLIGSDDLVSSVPPRASTTQPTPVSRPPQPAQPSSQQSGNLLGGMNDFLSGPPSRPTSTGSGPGGMSRPDLKQSILSLYASKPAVPAASSQPQTHQRQASSVGGSQAGGSFGGLNDAFGGLSFGSGSSTPASGAPRTVSPPAQKPQFAPAPKAQAANPNAYGALAGVLSSPQSSVTSPPVTSPPLSGGGFFDAGSKPPAKPAAPSAKSAAAPPLTTQGATDDWGDFSISDSAPAPASVPAVAPQPPASKNAGLLDFTAGGASSFSPPPTSKPAPAHDSVFNLSSKPAQPPQATPSSTLNNFPSDPWGSNEWANPDPAPAPASAAVPKAQPISPAAATTTASTGDFGWAAPNEWASSTPAATATKSPALDNGGWGDPTPSSSNGGLGGFGASTAPRVQPEEDFGGWGAPEPTPARPAPPRQESQNKPSGGMPTNEDLFGNVWG